jgi:hypothetical protein
MKALEREVRELRRANKILRLASAFLSQAKLDCQFSPERFIDRYRHTYGVEPICKSTAPTKSGVNPVGYIPPAEAEANYYQQLAQEAVEA